MIRVLEDIVAALEAEGLAVRALLQELEGLPEPHAQADSGPPGGPRAPASLAPAATLARAKVAEAAKMAPPP